MADNGGQLILPGMEPPIPDLVDGTLNDFATGFEARFDSKFWQEMGQKLGFDTSELLRGKVTPERLLSDIKISAGGIVDMYELLRQRTTAFKEVYSQAQYGFLKARFDIQASTMKDAFSTLFGKIEGDLRSPQNYWDIETLGQIVRNRISASDLDQTIHTLFTDYQEKVAEAWEEHVPGLTEWLNTEKGAATKEAIFPGVTAEITESAVWNNKDPLISHLLEAANKEVGELAPKIPIPETMFIKGIKSTFKEMLESHGPLLGLTAIAGGFALFSSEHNRKSKIRKHGRVRRHPFTESGYSRSMQAAKASYALAGAVGIAGMAWGGLRPGLQRNIFFGGNFALTALMGINAGQDPAGSIATAGIVTAAVYAGYHGTRAGLDAALTAVRGGKLRTSGIPGMDRMGQMLASADQAFKTARKDFPLLGKVITRESIALGTAVMMVPVVHSFLQRHMAAMTRRSSTHSHASFLGSQAVNQAGDSTYNPEYVTDVQTQRHAGVVNLNGSLKSHYNPRVMQNEYS